MKFEFEIYEEKHVKELENNRWLSFEIEEGTNKLGCSIHLMNHYSEICSGFLKEGCPFKIIAE